MQSALELAYNMYYVEPDHLPLPRRASVARNGAVSHDVKYVQLPPHTRQPPARPLETASSEPSIIMQASRIPASRAPFPHSRHVPAPDLCLAAPPTTQPVTTHSRPVVFSCPSSVSQLAHRSASLFRQHVPSTSSSTSAWLTVLRYVFFLHKSFFCFCSCFVKS